MRRLFVTLVGMALVAAGGIYFVAETYILPKQEKVWRGLLADLPEGYTADFADIDFELIGLRLTISDVKLSYIDGSSIMIGSVVAENSPKTALTNLLFVLLEREEENYDLVRFKNITPVIAQPGLAVSVEEIRVHNVAIGIDNLLPSTVKSLTGTIGLDQALEASSADGFEILGLKVKYQVFEGELASLSVLDISERNLGLFEIRGFGVGQGGQQMASLDLMRASNLNISFMMEPEEFLNTLNGGPAPDVAGYDPFHSADELLVQGFQVLVPGLTTISLKEAYYREDEQQILDKIGIVATKTSSGVDDYFFDFSGLAMMSPAFAQFVQVTEISSLNIDAESNANWDLASETYASGGWSELENLVKLSLGVELGKLSPDKLFSVMQQGIAIAQALPREAPAGNAVAGQDLLNSAVKAVTEVTATANPQEVYGAIELKKIHFVFENRSLVERLYRYGAAMMGATEADIKIIADQTLAGMLQDPTLPGELVDDIEAVRRFVAEPGILAISIEPPSTLTLGELGAMEDPNALVARLGINITANGVE